MSIGTKVIQNALKLIGAHSIAMPAQAETLEDGRDILNGMLASWESINILLGATPLNEVGDELNEPLDATVAIQYSLAVLMAPLFDSGKGNVSSQLIINERVAFDRVKGLYEVFVIPKKILSGTTPVGEGNNNGVLGPTFFGEGAELTD